MSSGGVSAFGRGEDFISRAELVQQREAGFSEGTGVAELEERVSIRDVSDIKHVITLFPLQNATPFSPPFPSITVEPAVLQEYSSIEEGVFFRHVVVNVRITQVRIIQGQLAIFPVLVTTFCKLPFNFSTAL